MSIEFNEKWAKGLDGEKHMAQYVGQASEAILQTPHALRTGGAASGIDYALAAACENADTEQEAYDHLRFIVDQLEKVRDNMRASFAEIQGQDESFERNGYLYVPEQRANVGGDTGWIWTRWTKQKGRGQALSGRAFIASGTSQRAIIKRFYELDGHIEGDEE